MRVPNLKIWIFLVFVFSMVACEPQGAAQEQGFKPEAREETSSQKSPAKATTEWLDYWPAVIELDGELITKEYFGPPNFGENPETDSKEKSWVLSLAKPINVRAKAGYDPTSSPSVESVTEVQLVLRKPPMSLIDKQVRVKGTLFHAHSGHHHTDVLMDVESISLVADR